MNITAAVLAYNLYDNDRLDLFHQTLESLAGSRVRVIPVDNHSTDGTADLVARMGGFCSTGRLTTCGHGTNICARVAIGTGADLCVLSDDDMAWSPGWAGELRAWWDSVPEDVILTGCHLEPVFPWNEIVDRVVVDDIPGLIRKSTGAASWSFRSRDWPKIGPVPEKRQGWGDVPTCERIWESGHRIAQLDLATHAGQGRSSWGNRTAELYGWDLEPARRALKGAQ